MRINPAVRPNVALIAKDYTLHFLKTVLYGKKRKKYNTLKLQEMCHSLKLVESTQPVQSYASVVVKESAMPHTPIQTTSINIINTTSISTQTEMTWPVGATLPTMIPLTSQSGARPKATANSQTPKSTEQTIKQTIKKLENFSNLPKNVIPKDQPKVPAKSKLPDSKPQTKKEKKLLYSDRLKKGDKSLIGKNKFDVLQDGLEESQMDCQDHDHDRGPSDSRPK